jgi:hypothetical protein
MPIDLEKIGKLLKEKRELQGLTLVDVSNSLCIRKSLINAIETGNWELLPHQVYVRGYLKEYAHLLNIYNEVTDEITEITHKEETEIPIQIPARQKIDSKHSKIPKRLFVYPLAFALVVGFIILSQVNRAQNTATQIRYAERMSKNIIDNAGSDKQNIADPSDVKKLMITCQERTWVSVVIDDTEKKEFMLNPQDIIILNAKEKYDLLIGNAGGVKLILDGKDIQFTGISGEVKRIKLS